jgi:mannose-6-phosphate isomerase-like protein (cupin superfamily)
MQMSRITQQPRFAEPGPVETLRRAAIDDVRDKRLWPVTWLHSSTGSLARHHHPVDEMYYHLKGAIQFTDVETRATIAPQPGERLFTPAGTEHEVLFGAGALYIMGLSGMVDLDKDFVIPSPAPSAPRDATGSLPRRASV